MSQACKVGSVYGPRIYAGTSEDMKACLKQLGGQYRADCSFVPLGETTCEIVTTQDYETKRKAEAERDASFVKSLRLLAARFAGIPPIFTNSK